MQQTSANSGTLGYQVNNIRFDMPWEWLAAGWRDMWRVWPISLGYGAIFAALAFGLLGGLAYEGSQSIILSLAAGFLLLGPLMAVGLYEASRRLETGKPVTFGSVAFVKTASPLQLAYVGMILTMLFLFWVHMGMLLYGLFFSYSQIPSLADFVPMVLLTANGVTMLVVGSIVGGILAVTAFTLSVVSIPLLMDQETDFISAIATSIKAMVQNPKAMLLWAGIIAGLMALGMVTIFAGLVITFPLVGHATWHAYRAIVVLDEEAPDTGV